MGKEILQRLGLRYSEGFDVVYLFDWFMKDKDTPEIRNFFMSDDPLSLAVGAYRWSASFVWNASITLTLDGVPIGIASLWLNDQASLRHTGMFGMIIDPVYRGYGFGNILCNNIIHFGKDVFEFEYISIQVMEGNDVAVSMYKKFGFIEKHRDMKFMKRPDGRYQGVFLMSKDF